MFLRWNRIFQLSQFSRFWMSWHQARLSIKDVFARRSESSSSCSWVSRIGVPLYWFPLYAQPKIDLYYAHSLSGLPIYQKRGNSKQIFQRIVVSTSLAAEGQSCENSTYHWISMDDHILQNIYPVIKHHLHQSRVFPFLLVIKQLAWRFWSRLRIFIICRIILINIISMII